MAFDSMVVSILEDHGYWGILVLILIENIIPPIPSEVILAFGGFLTFYGNLSMPLVIIFATIGSVVGAILLYWLGRLAVSNKWATTAAKFLRFGESDTAKAREWFESHGSKAVFICRFVPIVRSLISIPAGMAKMRQSVFLVYTAGGTLIWNTALVALGSATGRAWNKISDYFSIYSRIALIAIVFLSAVAAYLWVKRARAKGGEGTTDEGPDSE